METNGNNHSLNKAGWYMHKESGKVVKLEVTPEIGTPIIDAYVQVGFVPVSEEEAMQAKKTSPEVISDEPQVAELTNKELIAKILDIKPELGEKTLKKLNKTQLKAQLVELEK